MLICFIPFQEVLVWITNMLKDVGDDPSDEKVKDYVLKTLDGGVGIVYVKSFRMGGVEFCWWDVHSKQIISVSFVF